MKQDAKKFNTKEFDKLKPKGSKGGLKGLLCFLLVLLFMSASTVSMILGAYLSSINDNGNIDTPSPSTVNGTVYNDTLFIDTDYLVQVCVYNGEAYRIATGMVISEDGYIITCDHLFEDIPSAQMLIILRDGTALRAAYIGGDDRTDIAVLKVEQRNMVHVTLDPTTTANIGQTVFVAECSQIETGDPVITKGILSSDAARVSINTDYPSKLLQFDAAVSEGASGGALYNSSGELIGMIVAKSSYSEGVGYAISIKKISSVIDEIINNGCVLSRIRLGFSFEYIGIAMAEVLGAQSGLKIKTVSNESDLYQYGFEDGDTITHINGKTIMSLNDFYDVAELTNKESTINLTIRRTNGEERHVDVKLLTEKGSNSYIS